MVSRKKRVLNINDSTIFEKFLELDNDNSLVRFTLGYAFLKRGQFEKAIEQLKFAVKYDPEYHAAWRAMGESFIELNMYKEAVHALQKGLTAAKSKGDQKSIDTLKTLISKVQT